MSDSAPKLWFLTHPEVSAQPDVPVPHWGLSEVGQARAERLRGAAFLGRVSAVWSSTETKARQTAQILTTGTTLVPLEAADLGENDRSSTGFLPPDEFERVADAFFAEPDVSIRGWVTASTEQHRIVHAVRRVLADPRSGDGDIVICAHGGVGTLLLCHLLGIPIDRREDQPSQGHFFLADRETSVVRHRWQPLETLR